ncbi:hypothetical protein EUX98_g2577 [Antrodiella citrinella]|uniref:Uncharacterized protein n=1 Tax=Antrodiella citrinella TaxID=2447956 RepID=A0A4S4N1I9_9APHY|nr:hypothetical protein EUX98_g2577 [Antrodiella citrinella]
MPTPADPDGSPTPTVKSMSGSERSHQPLKGLNDKGYESVLKLHVPEWPADGGEKGEDETQEEIPNIPTEADSGSRRSKARSFVGGFVTSLRSIPRAVTHSSVYDRRTSSGRQSSQTDSQSFDGHANAGHPQLWYRGPPPPPLATLEHGQYRHRGYPHGHAPVQIPILLAHPPPPGIPHYEPRLSTIGSEYYSKQESTSSTGGSISSRLGEFLGDLNSLPWIAPGRVAIDYRPGETPRARSTRSGSNGSWYSINPPSTPSDISNRWKYVPEPWFPPTQLPPTQELDEDDDDDDERIEGSDATVERRLQDMQEALQEKTRDLDNMRQVVEHQKMHIAALETEIAELRERQSQNEVRRWRSTSRKSLSVYRKRDSVRTVTSMRRPNTSMSRPASSFYED